MLRKLDLSLRKFADITGVHRLSISRDYVVITLVGNIHIWPSYRCLKDILSKKLIIFFLKFDEPLIARVIADELGVSNRTLSRDIGILRRGIPTEEMTDHQVDWLTINMRPRPSLTYHYMTKKMRWKCQKYLC